MLKSALDRAHSLSLTVLISSFSKKIIKRIKYDPSILLTGFESYAKLYGVEKLNMAFRVPKNDSQWPKSTWGLPIGACLDRIRNRNSNREIRPQLQKLGFNLEPNINYSDLITALNAYKSINGHVQVPSNYFIPRDDNRYPDYLRGKHLGAAVHGAQKYCFYEEHHDELKEMGVNFELIGARHVEFDVIYDASVAYHKIHGNLDVPHNFIVPYGLSIYPKHIWGLELGCVLGLIRTKGLHFQHKDKLIPLGLNLNVKSPRDFETVYSALATYKSIHDNLNIPQKFIVPSDDVRYPRKMWGMKLGQDLHGIRFSNTFFEHREQLVKLGVNFDVEKCNIFTFDAIYSALVVYKSIHGNLLVPKSFIIPDNDSNFQSSETWGMNLGSIVHNIRNRGDYVQYKQRLTALGFVYDVKDVQFERIYSALVVYKSIHGNVLVPQSFAVAHNDSNYPSETWGTNLGIIVNSIRNRGDYAEYKQRLTELGFVYDDVKDVQFERIYSALVAYKSIHGNVLVRKSFVVPHNDSNYPSETWGMKLGTIVSDIRNKDSYYQHKERLTELGFVYAVKDVHFERIYSALVAYKSINGNVLVPQSYVIPHNDSNYPSETWDMKLGNSVHTIRNRGDYSEYKEKLQSIGFKYNDDETRDSKILRMI